MNFNDPTALSLRLSRFSFLAALAAICVMGSSVALGQGLDPKLPNIEAGILNANKNKLIVLKRDEPIAKFTQAWCDGTASPQPIKFVKTQSKVEDSNPSEDARSFDKHAGDIYIFSSKRLRSKTRDEASNCFLMNTAFMESKELRPIQSLNGTPLLSQHIRQIASIKNRKIKQSWALGRLADGTIFGAVLFVPQGANELASYVLLTPKQTLFDDMPVTRKSQGGDLWGLEDGGIFDPRIGDLYFSYKTEQGVVVAYKAYGAEGTNMLISEFKFDGRKSIYHEYFYILH